MRQTPSAARTGAGERDNARPGRSRVGAEALGWALAGGRVNRVRRMLGRPYTIEGTVVRGKGLGGPVLSFPTANVQPQSELLPAAGVYATLMWLDGRWQPGVTNIGLRPTVEDGGPMTVETHLLDFERDIYGARVRLSFLHRLRAERKFPSLDALRDQIARDVVRARRFFRSIRRSEASDALLHERG